MHELWVIDVSRQLTHVHSAPTSSGYATVTGVAAQVPLEPALAPAELGFKLTDLVRP